MSKHSADEKLSLPLPAEATLCDLEDMCRALKMSRPIIYQFLEDGTLPSFTVGTRRFCTAAQLAECVRTLAQRGKSSPKPSAKAGPQYGRPTDKKTKSQRATA